MDRRKKALPKMELVCCWKQQSSHVDGEKVGAVATSHGHSIEQASARNAHSEDCVTKVAVDVAELL